MKTLVLLALLALAAGVPLTACGNDAAPVAAVGMCAEHGVLEAECPWCHEDLVAKLGECEEHGVAEALCWQCKPSLVTGYKLSGDWCGEHGLPESLCVTCDPSRTGPRIGRAAPLPEDGVSVTQDPSTPRSRRAPSATCASETMRVRLASPDIAKSAGFRYEEVRTRKVVETLAVNAEFAFVQRAYARLAARVGGTVREVGKDLGDAVRTGDVLAVVEAPELGAAKAEILQAQELVDLWKRNHERERGLLDRGLSTQRDVISAETSLAEATVALTSAKQRLRNLGVQPEVVERVIPEKDTSSLALVRAPFAGVVVEREAVVGEVVDTAKTLFAVADTSQIWAMLDVPEADAARVHVGQSAVIQVGGARGERVAGKVSWLSPRVETGTRTVKVRVELVNPAGTLRAGMFGTAEIRVHEGAPLPVVPKSAVQWEGCCNVVFLRQNDQLFLPRKVKLGADLGDYYAVESGVSEGDVVVTDGSFLLRTEIRKESIGAGCCAED